MGLDVTVFIGQVHDFRDKRGLYFQQAAMVELMHEGRDLTTKACVGAPCFFYGPDGGDKAVTEDRYGVALVAVPVSWLREAAKDTSPPSPDDPGHRLAMLRALLKSAPKWVTHAVVYCH